MHTTGNGHAPRFHALASNGDGTLIKDKQMSDATAAALKRWRAAGRKMILSTGENSDQLQEFPNLHLIDLVVAENGAILYSPTTKEVRPLAGPPPAELVRALEDRGVEPLTVGRVIVCTQQPHDRTALEIFNRLGLDWQVIYNRREVMLAPRGIDKATGLARGLAELGLSREEVAGIGDALNDVPLLRFCALGAAVANAVPDLKKTANLVTDGGTGDGVVEFIDGLMATEADGRVAGPA